MVKAYENAKNKGIAFPGFLTFNAATLIDCIFNKVIHATIVSALDQTEMQQYAIPYQVNGYGIGHLGTDQEEAISHCLPIE